MPSSAYQWDPATVRYRDPVTGRYITRDAVREILDGLITKSQQRITHFSNEYRQGGIAITEWRDLMRIEIKNTLLAAEALASGGWAQLDAAAFGRVGARVKTQYQYLAAFTQQLLNGTQRTDGTFLNRARQYAAASRPAFHESMLEGARNAGYRLERNVLHPAEHCTECLDMTALGKVPLGTLVPIGSRLCRGNDRCTVRYYP
jgi:hypothetical protein